MTNEQRWGEEEEEEGVTAFDLCSETWRMRRFTRDTRASTWLALPDGTALSLFYHNRWCDGAVCYIGTQGRFYFIDEQETLAIPLARDMMIRAHSIRRGDELSKTMKTEEEGEYIPS